MDKDHNFRNDYSKHCTSFINFNDKRAKGYGFYIVQSPAVRGDIDWTVITAEYYSRKTVFGAKLLIITTLAILQMRNYKLTTRVRWQVDSIDNDISTSNSTTLLQ